MVKTRKRKKKHTKFLQLVMSSLLLEESKLWLYTLLEIEEKTPWQPEKIVQLRQDASHARNVT